MHFYAFHSDCVTITHTLTSGNSSSKCISPTNSGAKTTALALWEAAGWLHEGATADVSLDLDLRPSSFI